MSSQRVQKIYQGLTEQLRKLGPYAGAFKYGIVAQGRDALGRDAVVIDVTSQTQATPTWASGNLRVLIAANPATDANNTAAFKTQSHAQGYYIDGSVGFDVTMETPASWTGAHARFHREVQQALAGQLGAPLHLLLTANATEPTLNGLNGAVATAATTDAGQYQPYFFALPGGV
jgi:hypothetical protein